MGVNAADRIPRKKKWKVEVAWKGKWTVRNKELFKEAFNRIGSV